MPVGVGPIKEDNVALQTEASEGGSSQGESGLDRTPHSLSQQALELWRDARIQLLALV